MVEAIAQLGAYAVLSSRRASRRASCRSSVGSTACGSAARSVPGDTLDLEITLGRMSARAGKGHGRALGRTARSACEADLLFVLVDAVAHDLSD